jgi:outer membrane cobalamin receptor
MEQPLPGIKYLFLILLAIVSLCATAQKDSTRLDSNAIYNMSLEQLLNLKETGVSSEMESLVNSLIGVASKKSLSLRKSPSVVTLITQEEIEKSGARDLIDVLRLVPGIDFAVDVQGNVSIGMRGNWAEEGKVLLLLDGQELNELMYSSLQFGNHYDVSQIKRIEIIRGPGSAIYGGFAEYGVISIITKDGEDLHGISATASYGETARTLGYRDVSLSIGDKIKDFQYSLAGFIGQANRSDNTYTDFSGSSYNMANNSDLNPTSLNLKLAYKGLSLKGFYDDFDMTTRDNYGPALSKAYPSDFLSELLELKYDAKLSDKITLTPLISYKCQKPWNYAGSLEPSDSSYTLYDKTVQRYRGNLTMVYDVTKHINIVAGGEVFDDYANSGADSARFSNGRYSVNYLNTAGFAQILLKHRIANVILGARYDNNSAYGSAFVPRLGILKKIDKWSFKLLYSNSFRAPGIENINFSFDGNIKPETTSVIEFEGSRELTTDMFLTLNVFDITTKNPIVYYVSSTPSANGSYEGYKNMDEQGTRGAELDYRIKDEWGYLDLNYSFYTAAGKQIVPTYQVPNDNTQTLGFAANKLNLAFSYNITKALSVTPTISWIGQRYGYVDSTSTPKKFSPTTLANIFFMYHIGNLKAGIGCYNMFNSDYSFIQPYNGGHPPLPSMSREYEIRLTYNFNFKHEKKD